MAGLCRGLLIGAALVLSGGCYEGASGSLDIVSTRDSEFNSERLNTAQLNGKWLNNWRLNGVNMNGKWLNNWRLNTFRLNNWKLNNWKLNNFRLNGTEFSAIFDDNGQEIYRAGAQLVGAELELSFVGVDEQGNEVSEDFVLRFDDIYPDPQWSDVLLYDISYRSAGGDTWSPLCEDAAPVIPLQHYWDYTTGARIDDPEAVTFACTNAVLAKCVEWGYRPWATAKRCENARKSKDCYEVSLQDYHQACTRMARADYCGDGEPWTVAGTPIDIWDRLAPPIEARATDWPVEAEWTPNGAYCLNDIRQQAWKAQGLYPKCFLDKYGNPKKYKDCGTLKEHRALTVSAFDKYGEGMP